MQEGFAISINPLVLNLRECFHQLEISVRNSRADYILTCRSVSALASVKHGLLTNLAVKMAVYWARFIFARLWTKKDSNYMTQKRTWPIFILTEKACSKGLYSIWFGRNVFLRDYA